MSWMALKPEDRGLMKENAMVGVHNVVREQTVLVLVTPGVSEVPTCH